MLVSIIFLAALPQMGFTFTSKVTEKSKSMIESQEILDKVVEQTAKTLDIEIQEAKQRVELLFKSENCLSSSNELLEAIANCWDSEENTDVCPVQQVIPAGSAGFPAGGLPLENVPISIQDQCFGFVIDCLEPWIICDACALYRTIDGTCNNLNINKHWGSINQAFIRLVPNNYDDFLDVPTGGNPPTGSLPSPREISNVIHAHANPPTDNDHTLMVMQLGQFLDHDITFTPELEVDDCCPYASSSECFPLTIDQPDPHFPSNVQCLHFARSAPKCAVSGPRNQFSSITAYVDGSQIYGSTESQHLHLRTLVDGQLKTSAGDNLPTTGTSGGYSGGGCLRNPQFEAGDIRVTENPGLQSLHTIFMREHNRIAKIIKIVRSTWNDEKIYQEARRIVVAEWQNIVYGEFLPEILGPIGVQHGVNSQYDSTVDPTISNVFATAAFRFGHSLISGKVEISPAGSYELDENFGDTTHVINGDLDGILKGAAEQYTDASDRHIHNSVRNNLFKNIPCHHEGGDLAARNIQRGRDHGLGGYIKYRNYCGVWQRIDPDLLALYDGVRNNVEIFPAGLLEQNVVDGLVGPTFFCLIKEQFQRLKDGDRFFFTHEKGSTCDINSQRFSTTEQQLIMGRKLRDIICDNSGNTEMQENVLKTVHPVDNPIEDCANGNRLDQAEIVSLLYRGEGIGFPIDEIRPDFEFEKVPDKGM